MSRAIKNRAYIQPLLGTSILSVLAGCKGEPLQVREEQIIALAFDGRSDVPIPLTWHGAVSGDFAILQKNGEVFVPASGKSFDSKDMWFDHCKSLWDQLQFARSGSVAKEIPDHLRDIHAALLVARGLSAQSIERG
ncbi:hypothetical protein ACFFKC_16380 [Pseudoduganella danionis]|uniref:Uncharacterized protein n=1 Tax=Pseudoduganella danionis TaxID=1890295 RepID=A0ABW9SMR4_9BURK|nr:hypothetical protein [Pseudoduganella danionis]MTW33468.1 hypothetical protein [Pseudoduganella danionis]